MVHVYKFTNIFNIETDILLPLKDHPAALTYQVYKWNSLHQENTAAYYTLYQVTYCVRPIVLQHIHQNYWGYSSPMEYTWTSPNCRNYSKHNRST